MRYSPPVGVIISMSPQQLAALIDAHSAALTLYARQWTAAPEDVVQDAFVRLSLLATPPDYPVGWLYRVVRHAALDARRTETRRRRHETAKAAQSPSWFVASEPVEPTAEAVESALARLPDDLREPVVAHLWGGRTFAEIGELMGVSASTAHRRYLDGLALLRERLGE